MNVDVEVCDIIYDILVQMIPVYFSTNLEGFQAMDHIGDEEPPGRSILTFSSPFLFLMLTTPFIMPRARYWPSFVHLQSNVAK